MTERYPGLDLLADVFEDTENAPNPAPVKDAGGNLIKLWPDPGDPRWTTRMHRRANGDVACVYSCVPSQEPA